MSKRELPLRHEGLKISAPDQREGTVRKGRERSNENLCRLITRAFGSPKLRSHRQALTSSVKAGYSTRLVASRQIMRQYSCLGSGGAAVNESGFDWANFSNKA
jgi:hypothetical protein